MGHSPRHENRLSSRRRDRTGGDGRGAGGARRARARTSSSRTGRSAAARSCELGTPLPDETLAACKQSDAVLLGAVGLPQLDAADVRPEQGLIGLRRELDVYANLRPARSGDVDLLVVRELVGGLYYGASGTREDGTVFDTCEYHPSQVERIARRAFGLAADAPAQAHLGRQGERARDLAALAPGRDRGRGRLSGRRARARARRHGRDAARPGARALRRRSSPRTPSATSSRTRRRGHRRARAGGVGEPRRRRAGHLRAGARLGSRHRRPRDGQPGGDAPLRRPDARARPRPARARRTRSTRPSTRRSTARRHPTSGARRPPRSVTGRCWTALGR